MVKKRKLTEGHWIPLAKKTCTDSKGRSQFFIVFKRKEENDNEVSDTHGLDLLAQAAEKVLKANKTEEELIKENPVLVKILSAPPLKSQ